MSCGLGHLVLAVRTIVRAMQQSDSDAKNGPYRVPEEPSKRPMISVVVCTRNRCEQLFMSVGSLCELRTDGTFDFEILVVDNGSTDDTAQTVIDLIHDHDTAQIRYIVEPQVGIVPARNRGIAEASGDWIAFFDDDQMADPRWLIELLRCARERRSMLVGGQVRLQQSVPKQRKLGRLCRDLLSENLVSEERPYDRRFKPTTGNLMVHRFALDVVDRFQDAFDNRGEDTLLYLKLEQFGVPGWHNPAAIVHHVIPAARLTENAFIELTRFVGQRMPRLEKYQWKRLFPFVWLARAGSIPIVFVPRYLIALFSGDEDQILEAKCQLLMTKLRVQHGVGFLLARRDQLFADPQLK